MFGQLMERLHFVKGLDPVANAFAGTVRSDVVSLANFRRCLFVIYDGVGTTGTSTWTVNACDNTTPSNRSAISYTYREILTGDTEGARTAAGTSGYTNTAGSSKIILIEVSADQLAASGYGYVELTSVESVANAVLGGILVILGDPRDRPAISASAIT